MCIYTYVDILQMVKAGLSETTVGKNAHVVSGASNYVAPSKFSSEAYEGNGNATVFRWEIHRGTW